MELKCSISENVYPAPYRSNRTFMELKSFDKTKHSVLL